MLPPELTAWLQQVAIQHYGEHAHAVVSHSTRLLAATPSVRPRTRVYTADNGQAALLLCLYGSLPCQIHNSQYNIPLEIWLPLEFPLQPPLVYVVPTTKMLLNPGRHVDANGRCYLPYLAQWQPSNDLVTLTNELRNVFSLESPVYAKPTPTPTPTPSGTPVTAQTPIPALPPKPLGTQNPRSPPPIPHIPQSLRESIRAKSPELNRPPPPQELNLIDSAINEQQQQQHHGNSQSDIQRAQVQQYISQILSSLEQQIQAHLTHSKAQTQQIKTSVSQFDKIFEFESKQLDDIRSLIPDASHHLVETTSAARKSIEQIKATPTPNPDEVIIPKTVLEAQMYQLVADDMAINDTLAEMNKAFVRGKLELAVLLKASRRLAREQYLGRVLIRKVAEELGITL